MAEYRRLTDVTGNLRRLCPVCDRLIHRVVSLARIEAVRGELEITFPQEVEPIRQGTLPRGKCHFNGKA